MFFATWKNKIYYFGNSMIFIAKNMYDAVKKYLGSNKLDLICMY